MAMANLTNSGGGRWRLVGWGFAVLLLATPFVAMQFTSDVAWTTADFLLAALMLGVFGLALELTFKFTSDSRFRTGVAFALAAGFMTIWVNGAVGMIGSEDNPYNLISSGIVVLVPIGSAFGGFRALGMARTMMIAAALQLAASALGAFTDPRGGVFSALFAVLWFLAGALLRQSIVPDDPAAGLMNDH